MNLRIRRVLEVRNTAGDKAALDFAYLALHTDGCGRVETSDLIQAWGCVQSSVSRRIAKLERHGFIDVTTTHGGYEVHCIVA